MPHGRVERVRRLSQGPEEQIEAEARTRWRKQVAANSSWPMDAPSRTTPTTDGSESPGPLSRSFRSPESPLIVGRRARLGLFALLHDVGRVAGIEASLRVVGHSVVHRGDFRRAGHDQFEFGRVSHDVARGVDTGNVSIVVLSTTIWFRSNRTPTFSWGQGPRQNQLPRSGRLRDGSLIT